MLKKEIKNILSASKKQGWVLEPDAKRLLVLAGLAVPKHKWATRLEAAVEAGRQIGYPVVGKVISPKILHKSEAAGVVVGIDSDEKLIEAYEQFSTLEGFIGMLVEETMTGVELIVGAKMDYQFGPIVLLGIGGTEVEIYQDTSIRMAPITQKNVASMVKDLRAHQLLEGYRGTPPINLKKFSKMMETFSNLVMDLEGKFETIDLNPVMCSQNGCVVADARILLKAE